MPSKNIKTSKIRIASLLLVFLWAVAVVCGIHPPTMAGGKKNLQGSFKIVSIGPGDSDLITVRARDAIRKADMVFCKPKRIEKLSFYVDFSGKQVLDGYGGLFRYYGKECPEPDNQGPVDMPASNKKGRSSMSCEDYHRKQSEFARLVRDAVSTGKHVVLLSGGDPTIYGPDIWSLQELHDLNPEVVPGMSCFNAANAALKARLGEVILTAPLTRAGAKDTIEQLAEHERGTMVIFMPRNMKELFARLSKAYAAETPAAIVENAGMADSQKVVLGTVGKFAADLSETDRRLALIYVGKAVGKSLCKPEATSSKNDKGKFYLVGMGPGDPDLASLRALKVIEEADLIFAGKRLSEKFQSQLAGKKVYDGYNHKKRPDPSKTDQAIKNNEREKPAKAGNRLSDEAYRKMHAEFVSLVRTAISEGKTVAMLDSGDPMIYGPCAWTLDEFKDLNTEVVPGVSCFNAANAALRAGVTQGKDSHSVILASGWSVQEMAVHQSAMVLFTMKTEFKQFIDSLSKHYASDTPVAIVSNAGYAQTEKVIQGTLGAITGQIGKEKPDSPYLLYVGNFLNKSVDRMRN
jgi:precorrin-4 methylase